ncbi:hypothetical protein HMPREF0880_04713 [Yokenella regensburgei ATCC 43003]|nr:hypothetical protein HMPREF0880_04713 [Yokenella regensburgei ATCC 43003]
MHNSPRKVCCGAVNADRYADQLCIWPILTVGEVLFHPIIT